LFHNNMTSRARQRRFACAWSEYRDTRPGANPPNQCCFYAQFRANVRPRRPRTSVPPCRRLK
jgi:hypothetical protein